MRIAEAAVSLKKRVEHTMDEMGWSQRQMAKAAQVSIQTIGRILNKSDGYKPNRITRKKIENMFRSVGDSVARTSLEAKPKKIYIGNVTISVEGNAVVEVEERDNVTHIVMR